MSYYLIEILEKIMQVENKTLNSTDLKDLIQKKAEHLIQNVFTNYSDEKKIEAAKEYKLLDVNKNQIKYTLWPMGISMIVNPIALVTNNGWLIPIFATLVILVVMYTMSASFRNRNIKEWFSYPENVKPLYIFMFKDSAVDEDVLRLFVKVYGNEELVKLLVNKESLTYKDIQLYITEQERNENIQNKTNKIREAVDCLAE